MHKKCLRIKSNFQYKPDHFVINKKNYLTEGITILKNIQ